MVITIPLVFFSVGDLIVLLESTGGSLVGNLLTQM